jgi:hypothetical protein
MFGKDEVSGQVAHGYFLGWDHIVACFQASRLSTIVLEPVLQNTQ